MPRNVSKMLHKEWIILLLFLLLIAWCPQKGTLKKYHFIELEWIAK